MGTVFPIKLLYHSFLLLMNNPTYFLLVFTLAFSMLTRAQISKPSLSPRIKTTQQVGMATVTLDYGQPNKQNRKIFGALIPYHKLWRTGANANTKFSVDRAVKLADQILPKGSYALYSIPEADSWTIIVSSQTNLWGTAGYDATKDVFRFKVTPEVLKDTKETFQIYFENFTANGGFMVISWENTKVSFPFFVDADAEILAEIDTKINQATEDISAQTYFDAAQFYYFKDIDLQQAEIWLDKACELRPNAFWYTYYKAEVAYALNKKEKAQKAAAQCLAAAQQSAVNSSDFGYIAKASLLLEKLKQH